MRVPCSEMSLVTVLLAVGWGSVSGLQSLANFADRPDDFPLWQKCPPRAELQHRVTQASLVAAWDVQIERIQAAAARPPAPAPLPPPRPLLASMVLDDPTPP